MAEKGRGSDVVRVEWEGVEDIPTVYANNVAVTHASGDEFYLIFGEAAPPTEMFTGDLQRIPIRAVAKVVLSPGSMLRIAELIYRNAQSFLEKARAAEADDGERTTH